MHIGPQTVLKKAARTSYRRLGDYGAVLNRQDGIVTILNTPAARLWESIADTTTPQSLTAVLISEYDVELTRATNDVMRLVSEWHERRLLTVVGSPKQEPVSVGRDRSDGRELLRRIAAKLALPVSCDWEVTMRCNERCAHCYVDAGRGHLPELDTEACLAVLRQLAEMGTMFLSITGGEALLRSDVEELIAAADSMGMEVTLLTNASLVTAHRARMLAEAGLSRAEVSLYGATPLSHEAITRVAGSFEKSLQGVRLLIEQGVQVVVKYLITSIGYEDRFRVRDLALSLGAGFSCSVNVTPTLSGSSRPCRLRLTDQQLAQVLREQFFRPHRVRCEPATHKLRLTPDGTMYPCDFIPVPVGKLPSADTPLSQWHSACAEAIRGAPWTALPPSPCKDCENSETCPRCPGLAKLEHGAYEDVHLEACRIARIYRAEVMSLGL